MDLEQFLAAELARVEAVGLLRSLRRMDSAQGPEVVCDGRRLINFSSNDYLGLASHPRLAEAACNAGQVAGAGSGASRLISGNQRHHEKLEQDIARFKNTAAALTFSTGYAAALGTLPALAGEGDVIILDKLCHASLIDAARLSRAVLRVFPHNHLEKLESHLLWAREKHPGARVLVVIESVYSMDGDLAPLREIVELKDRFGAWLFLDEAHGVGVLGNRGRGLADELQLGGNIDVQMGTLGKALGASGAYICGSEKLREYLINSARSFIFSTAPPPGAVAAATAAITLLDSVEGGGLVEQLKAVREELSGLLDRTLAPSAIFPIPVGDERKAVAMSVRLWEEGLFVPAIRYPTVARGSARLRAAVSAKHASGHLQNLAEALDRAARAG